jgi:ABC-type lipoprotein export system ATPase subunit
MGGWLTMAKALVEFTQLGRTYYRGKTPVVALEGATASVQAGGRIAVVGPSGGGKSTLLQLMGGLDSPTSGTITWPSLGKPETLRPRQVGYVFQTLSLLAPLTVLENVELPLLMADEKADTARALAIAALNKLDLMMIAQKLPEELSGGQAQRVAIARAFAGSPKMILADEPTGQLDHPTAQHLFDALFSALEGSDAALVVATHDLAIAKRLRTQWRLSHGRLEVQQ